MLYVIFEIIDEFIVLKIFKIKYEYAIIGTYLDFLDQNTSNVLIYESHPCNTITDYIYMLL